MFMMVFSTITPAMAATTEVACSECGDHDGHDHADEQGCHQEDGHTECNDELCNVKHDNAAADHGTASTSSISKSLAQKQAACSHTWTTVVTKNATCGSSGTYVTKCSKCGAGNPNGNGYIPATGKHTWKVTSTKNATCTANGSKSYKCSVCGQTKTETINKLGHNYQQVITKNATCGTSGTYVSKCSRCGAGNANGNGTIPATGKHTWDRSAATCTAAKKCTVCGTVGEAAKGHKWNVSAATCTTDKKCTVCGTVNAKATGHTWNISAATCTTDKKCTKCGTVGQKALGHNYQQVITKDATCGAQGTYVSKCSRCGAGNANGNGYIPATGKHTWDRSAATCTAAKKCTVCGTVGEAAKGHTWNISAANCTTAKKCTVCGTVAEAAKGHTWNISAATCTTDKKCTTCGTVGQKALGHDYQQVITKDATCGAQGTYVTKCSRCGAGSPNGNGYIPATGKHTWDRSAATCTADKKCTVCGTVGETAKGHIWNVTAATCTTDKKCTVCGTVGVKAPGHTWNISAATCTTDKKCTKCGTVGQKALGHDYKQTTTKEPTCGEQGIYVTKCTRCGAGSQNGNGYIAATGKHTWVYTSTTDATCTKDGYKLYTCSVCAQTKKETITKLGHDYHEVVTKQPTCGTQGIYVTKCSRCGNGSQNGNGYIPATGDHTWDRSKATCTEDKTCTVCGKVGEPAKGHSWNIKSSVYGAGGHDTYKCASCSASQELEHDYRWVVTKEPGNCESGERLYMCVNPGCGHVLGGESIQNYAGHDFLERDAATCTKKCKNCGYVAESHDFTRIERPGSVANTVEDVKICSDCGVEWIIKVRQVESGQGNEGQSGEVQEPEVRNTDVVIVYGDESIPGLTQVSFPKDANGIEYLFNHSQYEGNVDKYGYSSLTEKSFVDYMDEVSCFVYTGHGDYTSAGGYLYVSNGKTITKDNLRGRDFSNLDVASLLVCYSAQGADDYDENPYNGSIAYDLCEKGAHLTIGCTVPIDNNFACAWEQTFFNFYPQIVANAEAIEDQEDRDHYVTMVSCCLAMSVTETLVREEINKINVEYKNKPAEREERLKEFQGYMDNIVIFTNDYGEVECNTRNNDRQVGFTSYPELYDVDGFDYWTIEDYMDQLLDMYVY